MLFFWSKISKKVSKNDVFTGFLWSVFKEKNGLHSVPGAHGKWNQVTKKIWLLFLKKPPPPEKMIDLSLVVVIELQSRTQTRICSGTCHSLVALEKSVYEFDNTFLVVKKKFLKSELALHNYGIFVNITSRKLVILIIKFSFELIKLFESRAITRKSNRAE